jgi:hypothetical protein
VLTVVVAGGRFRGSLAAGKYQRWGGTRLGTCSASATSQTVAKASFTQSFLAHVRRPAPRLDALRQTLPRE